MTEAQRIEEARTSRQHRQTDGFAQEENSAVRCTLCHLHAAALASRCSNIGRVVSTAKGMSPPNAPKSGDSMMPAESSKIFATSLGRLQQSNMPIITWYGIIANRPVDAPLRNAAAMPLPPSLTIAAARTAKRPPMRRKTKHQPNACKAVRRYEKFMTSLNTSTFAAIATSSRDVSDPSFTVERSDRATQICIFC